MPLASNVTMTFTGYTVTDTGITLRFVCANPGPGEPSDYTVDVTDAEVSSVANLAQFRTLVDSKLSRKFRATGIASKLDPYIGGTRTL